MCLKASRTYTPVLSALVSPLGTHGDERSRWFPFYRIQAQPWKTAAIALIGI